MNKMILCNYTEQAYNGKDFSCYYVMYVYINEYCNDIVVCYIKLLFHITPKMGNHQFAIILISPVCLYYIYITNTNKQPKQQELKQHQ